MKNLIKEFKNIFECENFDFNNYDKHKILSATSIVNFMKNIVVSEDINYICTLNAFLNLLLRNESIHLSGDDLKVIYGKNILPALSYLEEKYVPKERNEVIKDFKVFLDKNRDKIADSIVTIKDLPPDDPWIQDNEWDKIYEQNVNKKTV